jgi:hypothetical protein
MDARAFLGMQPLDDDGPHRVRKAGGTRFGAVGTITGTPLPLRATQAIFGDDVSGRASQPLGLPTIGRNLDNTLRVNPAHTHRMGSV